MARWDSSRLREWNRAGAVPPSERTHLAACYDAEVAYADAQLGALLDALDAAGARARTLVCVTSDHGETLGEHDAYFGHAHHLFDATLLVPLVVSLPGRVARDARVTEPVRLLDLAPTLLEILGAGALREVEGRSFAPLAWARSAPRGGRAERDSGPVVARRAIAVAETRASDRADAELNPVPHKLAIRTAGGKLVRWLDSDSLEVYDLATDPAESRNVAAGDTALARSLASALSAWEDETGAAPPLEEIDEETRERLRSLGYIE
jgi:arylsulfatase A-like enzyme